MQSCFDLETMVQVMQQWYMLEDGEHFDSQVVYESYENLFSMKVHHGGSFSPRPGRECVLGNISFIDLVDIDEFSMHVLVDMVKKLGYSGTDVMYYHFKRRRTNLDHGLLQLGSYDDVIKLLKYVPNHKVNVTPPNWVAAE
ncbi:hypothetical protein Tco_0837532 [Tanacetum coccineum]